MPNNHLDGDALARGKMQVANGVDPA